MAVIDQKTYKKIEWYLYNYDAIKKALEDKKMDIIHSGRKEITTWGGGVSYHSDPTAEKGVKLCKKNIVRYEKWLKVVDKVLAKYKDTDMGKFIELKYKNKETMNKIMQEMFIERRTYYSWRSEIITYMTLLAVQERLIKFT